MNEGSNPVGVASITSENVRAETKDAAHPSSELAHKWPEDSRKEGVGEGPGDFVPIGQNPDHKRRVRKPRVKPDPSHSLTGQVLECSDHVGACVECRGIHSLNRAGCCARCLHKVKAAPVGAVPVAEYVGDTDPAGEGCCSAGQSGPMGGRGGSDFEPSPPEVAEALPLEVQGRKGLMRLEASEGLPVEVFTQGRWRLGALQERQEAWAGVRLDDENVVVFRRWGDPCLRALVRMCAGTDAGECDTLLANDAPAGARCAPCARWVREQAEPHPLRCDGCRPGESVTGWLCSPCREKRIAAGAVEFARPAVESLHAEVREMVFEECWERLADNPDLDPRTVAHCKVLRDLERRAS